METKKIIRHLGQELETVFYSDITDNDYDYIVSKMYEKPDFELVKQQMANIYLYRQTTNNYITDYYFKDLMYDTKIYYNKWSISEMLKSKDLVGHFLKRFNVMIKFFQRINHLLTISKLH